RQLELLRFRNSFPAFGFDSTLRVSQQEEQSLDFVWQKEGYTATLSVDLCALSFTVSGTDPSGNTVFTMRQEGEQSTERETKR
ncbi:MAG: hypothetical protein ABFC31_09445, partial [Clostridiaceae bacterium]